MAATIRNLPVGSASLRSRSPSTDPLAYWPKRFRVQVSLASGVMIEAWGETPDEAFALVEGIR